MPSAKILRERPTASIREIQFHATGNCLWIMFEDEEYAQWCGIFGAGTQRYEGKIIELSEGEFAILVAGKLYRVNANSKQLAFASEQDDLTDVIYAPDRDLLVGCDYTTLYVFGPQGLKWKSERVSWDGIELVDVTDGRVNGFVLDLSNDVEGEIMAPAPKVPFMLFLDEMHFESEIDRSWFDAD